MPEVSPVSAVGLVSGSAITGYKFRNFGKTGEASRTLGEWVLEV
jgi:hypothetical protein